MHVAMGLNPEHGWVRPENILYKRPLLNELLNRNSCHGDNKGHLFTSVWERISSSLVACVFLIRSRLHLNFSYVAASEGEQNNDKS